MSTYIFSLFNHPIVTNLLDNCELREGKVNLHRFPDGECMIDILSDIKGQKVILCDSFDKIDGKILPALFFAKTAKELGASDVGLVATYCPFMRQDAKFTVGQSLSSRCFAELIQPYFDWFLTPEPHLHRIGDLNEIFTIPAHRLHLTHQIGDFIARKHPDAFIIGPDSESEQWAQKVATIAGCEYVVLAKKRIDDHTVVIDTQSMKIPKDKTAIFIDDIISTGKTILTAYHEIKPQLSRKPILVGIHGIFAQNAYQFLETEFEYVLTTNTIPHKSNTIDITKPLGDYIQKLTQ